MMLSGAGIAMAKLAKVTIRTEKRVWSCIVVGLFELDGFWRSF